MPEVSDFCVPFRVRPTPWREEVSALHLKWMADFELVPEPAIPYYRMWNIIDLMGKAYPWASFDDLKTITDMMGWCGRFDDTFSSGDRRIELAEIIDQCNAVKAVVNGADPARPDDLYVRAFADYWPKLIEGMSEYWVTRFRKNWSCYLDSHHNWEHRIAQIEPAPTPAKHIQQRRWNLGVDFCYDLQERVNHVEVPQQPAQDPRLDKLRMMATNSIWVVNDTFSIERERARGEDLHNLYSMFEADPQRYGGDPVEAAKKFNEESITEFLEVERDYLSSWWRAGLSADNMTALEIFVDGLRNWMSSNLYWHLHTHRYSHLSHEGEGSLNHL